MFRILESQGPAKQNATTTIENLSGRLQSATLLEDRRAAILGLRSFAKVYPASVASGALRNLISCLNNDSEDVDSTKIILETLLMLFNPDESSPEASDDIALWLADEFTQRQENITALLNLLDTHDFFSRLYSLQLISAISTARPERTQECVYTAPLGVSRLVAVLDDKREAVRSEGLLLLTALTPFSPDLQKLVAFENAFDRVFAIIDSEGSLTHGGITIQDCLSLLANLLRMNISNQSYFRETGWAKQLAQLLREAIKEQEMPEGIADWTKPQRDKNVWGLLSVTRLFLNRGSVGTQANQVSFCQSGILSQVLDIGFREGFDPQIRAEALVTAGDLINSNAALQESFAQLTVISPESKDSPKLNGNSLPDKQITKSVEPLPVANVISGLLDLSLGASSVTAFNVRLSACECLKAYLGGHAAIKIFFLRRAIEGHLAEGEEPDNILTLLMRGDDRGRPSEPYRTWIASVLLFHLLYDDYETKSMTRGVAEGDAEAGEEVVTCIQTLSANLISSERKDDDPRISIGLLMILCGWLFEDPDAVNDFLGEGSNVESICHLINRSDSTRSLVTGLCAFLLGVVYEFSTKDSPIPRATLHQILTKRLGREQYVDKITKLREHHMIRDFEVSPQCFNNHSTGGASEVFFDKTFIDFIKDNFSRCIRAIDRSPDVEVPVIANGIQKGVSRELVDTLKSQVDAAHQTQQKLESDILTLERKLGQEQADHRKARESAAVELARIKNINGALQRNHEEDTQRLLQEQERTQAETARTNDSAVKALQADLQKQRNDSDAAAERVRVRNQAEVEDLKSGAAKLRSELDKSAKEHVQDLQTAHEDYTSRTADLEARLQRAEDKVGDAVTRADRLQADLNTKEAARVNAQTELDDMLMVLGDLEEKRTRDKALLKKHGEIISDDEEDIDGEGEEKADADDVD